LIEALRTADLLVLSVRRRTPPAEQLGAVRAYLAAGKPLLGIRTACHAFALRPTDPPAAPPLSTWQDFDPAVLGGHYTNHYDAGPPTVVALAPRAGRHPILQGISVERLTGAGSLYKVNPLENGTTPLLMGAIPGATPEPVAWTHTYGSKQARVFYTSLGHPDDFKNGEFRRLLVNGVEWAIGK
jgi:type 1 glutamine amidotransferase